ncbi:MAG: hypothetical protein J5872_00225, partial [Lachnospiraceae bacterium]|nr:hypothetical protein [Lachnospiraceae bacterium]
MRHYGRKLLGWAVLLVLAMMVFPGIRPRVMLAYGTDNQKIVLFSSQEDVPKETLGLVVTSYDEPYDGKPHSIMVNTDELPAGTTIYYSDVDPSSPDFKESCWETCNPEFMCYTDPWTIYVKAENPDYETAYGSGTIRISRSDLTVTITGNKNQTPITYDGVEHSVNGYTISIPDGADLKKKDIFGPSQDSASATATRKDAGTTEMTLKASDFEAMTENYNVTFVVIPGSITIDPANVTVTITGNKNQTPITYDGDEHSVNGYTISIPEGADLTGNDIIGPSQDSASATATRKDAGTTEMTLKAIDFVAMTENYNVTFSVIPG